MSPATYAQTLTVWSVAGSQTGGDKRMLGTDRAAWRGLANSRSRIDSLRSRKSYDPTDSVQGR